MMLGVALIAAATQLPPMVQPMRLSQVQSMNSRAKCVGRGFIVSGGVTNVVEMWRRGNFTWSVTNKVHDVMGVRQTNTFQERLDAAAAAVAEWRSKYDLKAAVVSRQIRSLQTKRAAYVKLRDAAITSAVKAIYQRFIDEIDEELAELEGGGSG